MMLEKYVDMLFQDDMASLVAQDEWGNFRRRAAEAKVHVYVQDELYVKPSSVSS